MFGMAMNSAKLFFTGKLFQDNDKVMKLLALGILIGAILVVLLGQVVPIWVAAIVGGAVSGFLQPILFKNLKYA